MAQALVRAVARVPDVVWASFWEAVLIGVAGLFALWTGHPMLFAPLGPTAFELVETPERPSGQLYHIFVGNACGIAAGFFALWVTGAWYDPVLNAAHPVTAARVVAAILSALITVALTVGLRAQQPASLAVTLLIALGSFQDKWAAVYLAEGVVLLAALGEPLRLLRIRAEEWKREQKRQGTGSLPVPTTG